MSAKQNYELCCKYLGRRVRIEDCHGNVHYGRIMRVDKQQVWIMPSRRSFNLGIGFWGGGFGFGGAGFGYGGAGFGYGIALGAILGITLFSIF